jgi:hypothetical protein
METLGAISIEKASFNWWSIFCDEYFVTLFVTKTFIQLSFVNSRQILVTVTVFCDFFRRLVDLFRKLFVISLEGLL